MTWKKRGTTYVLEHHLWAAALWNHARINRFSQAALAEHLGRHTTTVQYALSGKSNLTIARAMALARPMGLTRNQLAAKSTAIEQLVREEMPRLKVVEELRDVYPAGRCLSWNDRLLRAFQIENRLLDIPYEEFLGEGNIESDDILRARIEAGLSRWEAAKRFGVSEGSIIHWERARFPEHRFDAARRIYGALLLPPAQRRLRAAS